MFKDGYHIAHCQSTGNIFRYNPVQKPKIRFHLSTKETGFGMPIEAVYQKVLNHLQEEELLERRAGRIYLTPKGQDVSNYALAQFLFDETS